MRKSSFVVAALLSLGLAQFSHAAVTPSASGPNEAAGGEFGQPGDLGSEFNWTVNFTVDTSALPVPSDVLTVNSLGIYNASYATGLAESHLVELYHVTGPTTGTLLASV